METLYGKTLIAKNVTRWNSQLKMVRRIVEIDIQKVVEKRHLHLTSYEKAVLRELVEVLEPFEEATDILQGDTYSSISLVIPSLMQGRRKMFWVGGGAHFYTSVGDPVLPQMCNTL